MQFNKKKIIATLSVLLLALALKATTRRVLFIGDSYTYVNNMPLMLQSLAASLGDTLIYDQSDPGAYTFELHSAYAPTIAKIFSQQWDIVVLQDQSEEPAFPPSQVDTQVYPYARKLDSMIHANDSCTQTMFMMTWGHADGDPPNCPGYPVICTYDGMQQRLRDSYLQMTHDNNAVVAPVGAAWKVTRDSFPALWLYQADSTHPLVSGSYLESCVLYSSIFHKPTLNASYTDGLSASDANTLQRIAGKVVLDSLDQWQQYGHYPYAGFTDTRAGSTVTFSFTPIVPAEYSWHYGDGLTDTASSPVHTYTAPGSYVVSHTATTSCFSETLTDTLHIFTTAITNLATAASYPIYTVQHGGGNITFQLPFTQVYDVLEVFDASGRRIRRYQGPGQSVTDNFVPGFYTYRAWSSNRGYTFYNKLIAY